MPFELKVALRFLKEGRGQTIFILLGISIGVAVQVFLNTLISGLQADLINKTVGGSAHVWIVGRSAFELELESLEDQNFTVGSHDQSQARLSEWPAMLDVLQERTDLIHISPLAEGNGFLIHDSRNASVIIKGVRLEDADRIYNITGNMTAGQTDLSGENILIGSGLADENDVQIGDVIKLSLAGGASRNFTVSGIFDLGNSASNNSWVVLDIGQAQKLLAYGEDITRIEMQINEIFDAQSIDESLTNRFSGVEVDNWIDNNSSLLTALQSQSSSSIMIQVFVLLAITLGIASVLAVSVVQKSKQLGILKAMGTKAGTASRIFLLQGLLLGILGAALGAFIGIGLVRMFLWGTSLSTGTPLFPLVVDRNPILVIVAIATASSTLAALLPARRSSKLNPVDVIRNG